LACAAATANLQVWQQPGALQKLSMLNHNQQNCLAKLHGVKNPRVCGTIAAFEIQDHASNYLNNIALEFNQFAMQRGVLLRPLGNTVYVLPPYCTTAEDLENCYGVITEFLDQLSARAA
jgi:adenosylmethionine-8-amino-7-oxononanoate aminotransferase